jgi:hypothetical protein
MKKGTRPPRNRRKSARLRAKKKARVKRKRLKSKHGRKNGHHY